MHQISRGAYSNHIKAFRASRYNIRRRGNVSSQVIPASPVLCLHSSAGLRLFLGGLMTSM